MQVRPIYRNPRAILGAVLLLCLLGLGVGLGPLALAGPELVRITPADDAAHINPQSPLRLEFNQWVRPESVAAAIKLDPPVAFTTEWQRSAVVLHPTQGLAYGQRYQVTIQPGVKNVLGRASNQALTVAFATQPYVAVVRVGPADATAEVGLRSPVTVEFNLPIVAAERIAAAAENPDLANQLPQPLMLEPATIGIGRWLSPTLYGFYPQDGLLAASDYHATVRADVSGDGAAQMERELAWGFSTEAPLLVGAQPYDGASEVAAQAPIEVQLAPSVDIASAGSHFVLQQVDSGVAVAGAVEPSTNGFRFTPAAPLERGVRYEAQLTPGVQTNVGTRLNARPLTWRFQTMGDLAVAQVVPAADTAEVLTTTQRISVKFNHPVVALTTLAGGAALPQPLEISPALPGVGRWLDTSTYVYSPTAPLAPSTSYAVAIKAGLSDQTGGTLQAAYGWQFATITPRVLGTLPAATEHYANPAAPISINFNQPMQAASLQSAVTLRHVDSGAAIQGELKVSGAIATFTPAAPLERGAVYELTVAAGVQAATNQSTMAQDYRGLLSMAPLPALVNSVPANGERAANDYGLKLNFTTPMDWASVERNLRIEPKPTAIYTYTTDTELNVSFSMRPETAYQVTLGAASRDPYGVEIGQEQRLSFTTAPLPAALSIDGPSQIATYNAYTTTKLALRLTNLDQVSYSLHRLEQGQALQLLNSYEAWRSFAPTEQPVASATVAVAGPRNQERIARLDLGQLKPGMYQIVVRGGGDTEDRQLLAVSQAAVTIKRNSTELLIWAVDLASGQPIADLPLYAQSVGQNAPQELGRTARDGVLRAAFSPEQSYDSINVWSPPGERFSFGTTDWGEGINAWDFRLPTEYAPSSVAGSLATERPIYRPDQRVHMRGVIRLRQNEQYALPAAKRLVRLVVTDARGTTVFSASLPLTSFGAFSATLRLDRSAAVGTYGMAATLAGTEGSDITGSFKVAEYRKPAFEVAVTPSAPDAVRGDPLRMAVSAQYFSGGAVANAPVRWRLLAKPLEFSSERAPSYSFEDFDDPSAYYRWDDGAADGPRLVAEGTAQTDANGKLDLPLPLERDQQGSQRLTLDVEVTDLDGQIIAGQGGANLHAGAVYLGLRPEGYVSEIGQPKQVSVIALTPQGELVANQAIEAEIYQHTWYSVREQGQDQQFYWTTAVTETLVSTAAATTDAQGRASIAWTPKTGGTFRVQAKSRDSGDRQIAASAFTWVYGGDVFWGVSATNRIDLIADKLAYQPGETAKILVPAPYAGMTALMTIERGTVLEHRVIKLAGTTELLELPITADHAPNIYVSLVLVKAADATAPVPDIRVGLINLAVSTTQQELAVTISADKPQAGPREQVTYTITTQDHQGRGVQSEVALALVDKAVLTLADDPNPSLREAFYGSRPLGVFTSSSLTALMDRVALRNQPGAKGGGGSGEAEEAIRQEVPDTAYWNPALVTDADGKAQLTLTLPDNLTTWRMTGRSVSAATQVGEASSDLIATKPLLIRPAPPRFLTVGDQVILQAVVQNTTANPLEATVKLEADGLDLTGPAEQSVKLAANDRAIVRWAATAPKAGAARLVFAVAGGGLQDAVEHTLPIQRFATPEVTASAGQVGTTPVVETLKLPTGGIEGDVTLELVPSLAAGLQSGLEYLQTYPYECTEQTVSRFLPNAVSYRLLTQLGRADPALKAALEASLNTGLQRLYALQQLDGGWGWWAYDPSSPYMTAYVIEGMLEARKAGYAVDSLAFKRGLEYLTSALNGAELERTSNAWRGNARAYVLFVLAEAGAADQGRTTALYEQREDLAVYGRAYLLMALQSINPRDPRIQTLVGELMSSALLQPTTAHWEERDADYWTMNSDTRTTAIALQALIRSDPANLLVPNAVRHLMSLRDNGHWRTTQESALTLIALAEYIAQSGELEANYRYQATLDERLVSEGTVNRENLADPISVVLDLAQVKLDGGSQLALSRTDANQSAGKGRLYYTVRMHAYQDAADAQPLDQGLRLQREYRAVDSATLSPTGQLISQAKLGELIEVRLTLDLPTNMAYVALEDMLPAGVEALDTSLKTVSAAASDPAFNRAGAERPSWWYFTQSEIRDNRVALFATDLPKGTYHYTYLARATTPGTFQTLPAVASQMYAPEVFGRSAGARFVVTEP